MKTFPMFIRMTDRDVVILGGGEQALQKTRLMLKTEARLTVIATDLLPELAAYVAAGRITVQASPLTPIVASAALVFIATGCPGLDAALWQLAKAQGARMINVVDEPALCDAITPALVDRDPLIVAIGTEGTAPVLGREIRARIEAMLDPALGNLAAAAGAMRGAVAQGVPKSRRRAFWEWVFDGRHQSAGTVADHIAKIGSAIAAGAAPSPSGLVSVIAVQPGAADLLTLRDLRCLQQADVIFHDRLIGCEVLDLARRDAARVCVGPDSKADAMHGAAKSGQRVVRLTLGQVARTEAEAISIASLAERGPVHRLVQVRRAG